MVAPLPGPVGPLSVAGKTTIMKGNMLRVLAITLALCCAVVFSTRGADGEKKRGLTDDQKTARKELLEKYDKNKDGKLDKEEREAITNSEDKEKLAKAGWAARGKKKEEKKEEK